MSTTSLNSWAIHPLTGNGTGSSEHQATLSYKIPFDGLDVHTHKFVFRIDKKVTYDYHTHNNSTLNNAPLTMLDLQWNRSGVETFKLYGYEYSLPLIIAQVDGDEANNEDNGAIVDETVKNEQQAIEQNVVLPSSISQKTVFGLFFGVIISAFALSTSTGE